MRYFSSNFGKLKSITFIFNDFISTLKIHEEKKFNATNLMYIYLGPTPGPDLGPNHAVASPGHAPGHVTVNPGIENNKIQEGRLRLYSRYPSTYLVYNQGFLIL